MSTDLVIYKKFIQEHIGSRYSQIDYSKINPEILDKLIEGQRAFNTQRNLLYAWSDYIEYCREHPNYSFIPITVETLANYINSLEDRYKLSVIKEKVYSLSVLHQIINPEVDNPTKHPFIQEQLKAATKRLKQSKKQAKPLLFEDLVTVINQLDYSKSIHIRDRAILTTGWFGAFRVTELMDITFPDMELVSNKGYRVKVPYSKTDQEGKGHFKALPYKPNKSYCPVNSLRQYIDLIEHKGVLFRSFNKSGKDKGKPLTTMAMNNMIKKHCGDEYSSHSLRSGFVTSAQERGFKNEWIQSQTWHRDIRVLSEYNRPASIWNSNAASLF